MAPGCHVSIPSRDARLRRRLTLMLAVVISALALMLAPPASAHTDLVVSDPADGARLDAAPAEVTLTFNESMSPRLATVTLRIGGADLGELEVRQGATTSALVATIPEERVPTGRALPTWTISYRVTSVDGHPVEGRLSFRSTLAKDEAGASSAPSPRSAPQSSQRQREEPESGSSGSAVTVALAGTALVGLALGAVMLLRARRRSSGL